MISQSLNHRTPMGSAHRSPERKRTRAMPAFTLVEMVVVISIILVILGMALPAVKTMWDDRKSAATINTLQGLLMTARAKAMKADGVETGLFFFLDQQGTQRVVTIDRKPETLAGLGPGANALPQWQSVFGITADRDHVLGTPIRAVPRYVVEDPANDPDGWNTFSEEELVRNDFGAPISAGSGLDQAQRHRNYFTAIFSTEGQLVVSRDVLIQDNDEDGDLIGDRTGLAVGIDPAVTAQYYSRMTGQNPLDPQDALAAVPFLVIEPNDPTTAINFPSVDALLVYDDSLFSEMAVADPAAGRTYIVASAQPLYVSRWTGVVIRGPLAENVAP